MQRFAKMRDGCDCGALTNQLSGGLRQKAKFGAPRYLAARSMSFLARVVSGLAPGWPIG
jgi:hypothetical protein